MMHHTDSNSTWAVVVADDTVVNTSYEYWRWRQRWPPELSFLSVNFDCVVHAMMYSDCQNPTSSNCGFRVKFPMHPCSWHGAAQVRVHFEPCAHGEVVVVILVVDEPTLGVAAGADGDGAGGAVVLVRVVAAVMASTLTIACPSIGHHN